ncbi:MAG: hypothetical protein ACYSRP_03535 [Planctomycetota bacterium]|jgi:hypothetical protein
MDEHSQHNKDAYKGYGIRVRKQRIPGMITITVSNEESGPDLLSFHRFCASNAAAEKARNELLSEARRYIDRA